MTKRRGNRSRSEETAAPAAPEEETAIMSPPPPTEAKEYKPEAAREHSVVVPPPEGQLPTATPVGVLWFAAQVADAISPWGRAPKQRDKELRSFYPSESYFSSALGTVCARNAGFDWKMEGPPALISHLQDVLQNANEGEGWADLMVKLSIDLYTQDSGAFIEVVRAGDSHR